MTKQRFKTGPRLKWARENAGFETAREAAAMLGLAEQTYYNHERGIRKPGDIAETYARKFRVPVQWLLYGEGPVPKGAPSEAELDALPAEEEPVPAKRTPINEIVVREIDVRAGAGGGGVVAAVYGFVEDGEPSDPVKDRWSLPRSFVTGELRASPTNLDIIEVIGDSMEPTLHPGDRVVIDKGQTKPSPDGIFVLWDGYGIIVKRVELIRGRVPPAIRVISDNKNHEPFELELQEGHIIGRVVGRFSSRI